MKTIDMQARPVLARRVRLQIDTVRGAAVLLYPEGIAELNDGAKEIVARCDGAQTVKSIIDALAAEFEAPREQLATDVVSCLQQLCERNFIVLTP
jgi:pyrroloquinoline quinone biosynthesis protein D